MATNPPNSTNPNTVDVRQLMYVYDLLENQERGLSQQITMLQNQIQGVDLSIVTMEAFREIDSEHEVMLPLGTNAYTSAKLLNPKKILHRINREVLIEKDLEVGIEDVKKLLESFQKIDENLRQQLNEVRTKLNELRPQINQIYREASNYQN